jgi:pimeloyl-ACP methyl ester carboxylesterase
MTVTERALALAFAALALVHLETRRRITRAERRYPPNGEFINVDDARLHYLCRGDGPAVVLLHGNTGCLEDFAVTVMDRLSTRFRACAFDRPGHGYSQRPSRKPVSAEDQARMIHHAAVKLGLDKPILVGHSWSGALVLAYALNYPDDVGGIVLLGAQTHAAPPPAPVKHWILQSPVLGDLLRWTIWTLIAPAQIRRNLETAYGPNRMIPELVERAAALWGRPGQVKAMAEDFLSVAESLERMASRYGELGVPVVVLVGSADPFVDQELQARQFVGKVANARLVELPATGHEIAQSRPDDVIAAIEEAWKS